MDIGKLLVETSFLKEKHVLLKKTLIASRIVNFMASLDKEKNLRIYQGVMWSQVLFYVEISIETNTMKKVNYIFDAMGFENINDFLGTYAMLLKPFLLISISFGGFVGFIEDYMGIAFMLWVFLTLATLFDIAIGVYVNVRVLKNEFESKLFRGIFKACVVLAMIFMTNFFKLGIEQSLISPEFIKATCIYITATLHYSIVMLIALYLLLGINENGAKMEIPVCVSIARILRMRIGKIEKINRNSNDAP